MIVRRRGGKERVSARSFALWLGLFFVLVGVAGFIPPLMAPLHPGHPDVGGGSGQLFGLFPVNAGHNVLHLAFGGWGLAASRALRAAVFFARGVALFYLLLAVLGTIPAMFTLFGFAPLYGNDLWLHALLALAGAYFGWVHRNPLGS